MPGKHSYGGGYGGNQTNPHGMGKGGWKGPKAQTAPKLKPATRGQNVGKGAPKGPGFDNAWS